ncbi:Integumentary mucin A.1 [Fusarium oxysporum f. sp. albedinis]|nr:Integumentary mucin A.1 [Fusarium oxysporum f. sp. albedinis]
MIFPSTSLRAFHFRVSCSIRLQLKQVQLLEVRCQQLSMDRVFNLNTHLHTIVQGKFHIRHFNPLHRRK